MWSALTRWQERADLAEVQLECIETKLETLIQIIEQLRDKIECIEAKIGQKIGQK